MHSGVEATPRSPKFNVEAKVLLPSMCGKLTTKHIPLGMLWSNDDTKKARIQCRRDGFATLDVW